MADNALAPRVLQETTGVSAYVVKVEHLVSNGMVRTTVFFTREVWAHQVFSCENPQTGTRTLIVKVDKLHHASWNIPIGATVSLSRAWLVLK